MNKMTIFVLTIIAMLLSIEAGSINHCCSGSSCDEATTFTGSGDDRQCCPNGNNMNIGAQCTCEDVQTCSSQTCLSTQSSFEMIGSSCTAGYYIVVKKAIFNGNGETMYASLIVDYVHSYRFDLHSNEYDYASLINENLNTKSKTIDLDIVCNNLLLACDWCYGDIEVECHEIQWSVSDWGVCDASTCTKNRSVVCANGDDWLCLESTKPKSEEYCCSWSGERCITEDGTLATGCTGGEDDGNSNSPTSTYEYAGYADGMITKYAAVIGLTSLFMI